MTKKVLKVAKMIDSLSTGGAERLASTFAQGAKERDDIDVTVISLQDAQTAFRAEIEATGTPVFVTRKTDLFDLKRFFKLYNFLRREKFDVIHANLSASNILAPILGMLTGIPVVSTLHSNRLGHWEPDSMQGKLQIWLLAHVAKDVIGVGPRVVDAHQPYYPNKKLLSIPNAVQQIPEISASERAALREELIGQTEKSILLSVGRLSEQKGFQYLLDAVDELRKTHPDILLAIAGGGILQDDLEAQRQRLGLTEHVTFLGKRTDIPKLLKAVDIYVNSSTWEGLPISILEAMSAELPVVATDVGDISTIINDSTGILVESQNPTQLARAIARFLDDPTLRATCGKNAKQAAWDGYGVDHWVDQLVQVYRRACDST